MRVLHVIHELDPKKGGVSQAVRTIVTGLDKLDVENEVVSLDGSMLTFADNSPFRFYPLGPGGPGWAYNKKFAPWLKANLQRFDVVILHGLWLYHSYAIEKAVRALKRRNKRPQTLGSADQVGPKKALLKKPAFYVMPHGMLDPYFQKAKERRAKAIRNWVYWKLIERKVLNNADGVLFTCEAERRLAHQPFRPYHPQSEMVVGLGVDKPPSFEPRMAQVFSSICPEAATSNYILFLSRVDTKKGVDILIQAYSNFLESSNRLYASDNTPKLVIAGPGMETPFGKTIADIINSSPLLKNNVCFTGMLTGDAKWGAFYGCEAFILPSHQENFGIAVVEALACKKPVLISNQVNIWTEIESVGAGIVADDTQEGIAQLLERWSKLPFEAKCKMGQQAELAYKKYFALEPAIAKFHEAIL